MCVKPCTLEYLQRPSTRRVGFFNTVNSVHSVLHGKMGNIIPFRQLVYDPICRRVEPGGRRSCSESANACLCFESINAFYLRASWSWHDKLGTPVDFSRTVLVEYAKNLDNYVDAFVNVNYLNNDHLNTKSVKNDCSWTSGNTYFFTIY